MNWSPPAHRPPQSVAPHLDRLAEQLGDLSLELRASVAGLAGDAVGRAVRDALLRFWRGATVGTTPPPTASGWSGDEPDDEGWRRPPADPHDDGPSVFAPVPTLAAALQAAGWLLPHVSLVGLLGAGLGVGGLALLGRRLKAPVALIHGVADAASLLMLLNSGARHLRLR